MKNYQLSTRERDAVLAGLRLLQDTLRDYSATLDPLIRGIYMDNGSGLSPGEFDTLCERISQ